MGYEVIFIVASFAAFFVALTIHEFCHGFVAYLLGDETAKEKWVQVTIRISYLIYSSVCTPASSRIS